MTADAQRVVDALVPTTRHPLATALAAAPRASGIYAWWSTEPDISGVPGTAHGGDYLYYVGIASRKARGLHARLHDHIHKTTRKSTERVTLAALLGPERGWTTTSVATGKTLPVKYRTVLTNAADEAALSRWMADHLKVSWVELSDPRTWNGR